MAQFSHSRIECFEKCPYQYKLRYVDELTTLPDDAADNALFLGTAMHTGIEENVDAAIKGYKKNYPMITDAHINEIIKLQTMIPKARNLLYNDMCYGRTPIFEKPIATKHFIGFADCLIPTENENEWILVDFKYCNPKSVDRYLESDQLHLYKYHLEQMNPKIKIVAMCYMIIPKTMIRQKKTEDLLQFRKRLKDTLNGLNPEVIFVEYDVNKVIDFMGSIKNCLETADYEKNETRLCDWCEFKDFCKKGENYMLLPKNEKRKVDQIAKKTVWIYGAPFSGKTFFANQFPDPLMLNTDGNIKFVDAPYVPIKDIVKVEGRITKRQLAWDVFKEVIGELEKKDNTFKTIVVDLLEDTYEACRIYMYDKLGIEHESDNSFKAWDMVRTEFLSTMKRLMNLDYENIVLISHEDTSKDLTKKSGDKLTAIKPNLQEKCANKIAGMVDIVARVVADGNERTLNFKTNEVIFGGGRLEVKANEIPLKYDELNVVYAQANFGKTEHEIIEQHECAVKEVPADAKPVEAEPQPEEPAVVEEPKQEEPVATEEKPVRKTRKKRGEQ